jgi:hypothetical protein
MTDAQILAIDWASRVAARESQAAIHKTLRAMINSMKQVAEPAPPALSRVWIPATERLPNEFDEVLVAWRDSNALSANEQPWCSVAWWHENRGWYDAEGAIVDVTHWMPHPAPPTDAK